MTARVNLLDFSPEQLVAYCNELGEKPYRAKQLQRWLHVFGADKFDAMTDLAKSLREKLSLRADVNSLKVISDFTSVDGTRKWLLDVGDGNAVETVFIPKDDRGTLCVSTQVGCTVNCRFCSTGKQGFSRNLTTGEIIGQLRMAEFALRKTKKIEFGPKGERQISNVVLMGMGEPLLNYDATLSALKLMLDDNAYGLSRRRVTVSTSGIIPMMDKLAQDCPVALAVSLHAPNDELRNKLVPMNRKYGLAELMKACSRYLEYAPRESIMFEYCMLDGVNDTDKHAKELITLVTNKFKISCKFNLIPFNPYPESGLRRSSDERIRAFGKVLLNAGFITTVRKSRGEDVDAACGQLAGEVKDRTRLRERMLNFANKNREFHSVCAFTEEYV